ncbi:hypothetical protein OKA05_14955 [Luteolibacter arcticus]|uniref:PA14 domain-containing protein n=1 Tax=Luteolibacter arcticus TaxID=1581411 RepID=A0ABT3GK21_9BACT|nr:hypothetical protein [Luteolibacter arcticus]MCW1923865.1 hypothetical protein [Luteolibacter arcticus]
MNPSSANAEPEQTQTKSRSGLKRLIARMGLGAFTISMLVHAIFILLAIFFFIRWVEPPPEKIDFLPGGGGGGSNGTSHRIQPARKAAMTAPAQSKRIASTSLTASFSLPDSADNLMDPGLPMDMGAAHMGSGGGVGGGSGAGSGTGVGSGTGPGSGPGFGKGFINPFGIMKPTGNALVGTFYDFKQNQDRKPTGVNSDKVEQILHEFINNGWKERALQEKYYKATQTLYQTKIYLPTMPAKNAPAAFQCEKEVQPSCWAVIYRGTVSPPESGRFRFVGFADNVLAVRFDGKLVFDYGVTILSGPTRLLLTKSATHLDVLAGKKRDKNVEKQLRRAPASLPMSFYPYPGLNKPLPYNDWFGGLAVGPEFAAFAGKSYEIEILTGEMPGAYFSSWLMIEQSGKTYQKTAEGSPILPLFRLDDSLPSDTKTVPVDPNGPVWRCLTRNPSNDRISGLDDLE